MNNLCKADRIRQLAHYGLTNAEMLPIITEEFGKTNPSYIRAVSGQRLHGKDKASQRWYWKFVKKHGCNPNTYRSKHDDAFRERRNAYHRARYWRQKEAGHA